MKTFSLNLQKSRGFSLIELMIVVAMLSLVMGAVYSLYTTHQRSAYTQDEVVEVQQNLRIAMESLGRDIRMAGFMVPINSATVPDRTAIRSAGSSTIVLNTASESGTVAVMDLPGSPAQQTGLTAPFQVDSLDALDGFTVGNYVRIVDPQTSDGPKSGTAPTNTIYQVAVKGTGATPATTTMTLNYVSGDLADATVFLKGDVIAKIVAPTAPNPNTVRYYLENNQLKRKTNENVVGVTDTQVVATNISALTFGYLLDNNTETSVPADLSAIRAVRVTITGQTSATASLSGGAKTRSITSVLKIRNRAEL